MMDFNNLGLGLLVIGPYFIVKHDKKRDIKLHLMAF